MNDILDELYRRFYHPYPQANLHEKIDNAHQQLIDRLEKPERKLILRIIDTKDMIAGIQSTGKF